MNKRDMVLKIMGQIEEWADENDIAASTIEQIELAERIYNLKFMEKPTHEERLLVVEALREKAANLAGFSGKVGSRRGAKALARLETCVKQMEGLADRFEASR